MTTQTKATTTEMNKGLMKVAIRQKALFIPQEWITTTDPQPVSQTTLQLLAKCKQLGFSFSENLLHVLNAVSPRHKLVIFDLIKEIMGIKKNWTPLVKQWDIPTGESFQDHVMTYVANLFRFQKGTTLACGHLIPPGTFPLERYNGCPFCGTPFEFEKLDYKSSSNKLKTLELWTEADLENFLKALLESPVALDATQIESLKTLVKRFGLVSTNFKMKETTMIAIDALVQAEKSEEAGQLFKTPKDILRYIWYKQTGLLQLVKPKVLINRIEKNTRHVGFATSNSAQTKLSKINELKLKFSRAECRQYASWINSLDMAIDKQCEVMHPNRGMWVRVIRALRLAEYSKRKGYEQLATLMDMFYNEKYTVWQGTVNNLRLKMKAEPTFRVLKQRPGLFARSLFSSMLWFGPELAIEHFKEVMYDLPPRLVYTLNMYAANYFQKGGLRTVKPLGGVSKSIPRNQLTELYDDKDLKAMQEMVKALSMDVIRARFAAQENTNKTVFIDEGLFKLPIAIGDRSEQIQDLPAALPGTRFPVEGDTVRLFLQWGEGLPAQHLDMDLSCKLAYDNGQTKICSYANLRTIGCKHSGDIQRIPAMVGTAEYIDVNVEELKEAGVRYVSFTCNAYSSGSLSPNLIVGWMNSANKMRIYRKGVAYNPADVQHMLRIKQSLNKGLLFGVLDVYAREVVWMEMPFGGQIVQNLDTDGVESLLGKLDAKLKIGDLLALRAEIQGLERVADAELADEAYALEWALQTDEVNALLLE